MTTLLPLKRLVDPSRPITYGIVQAGPDVAGGIPYIRPVDMTDHDGVSEPKGLRTTSREIAAQYQRSSVQAGDIVVSIGPSYGKTMIVPSELDGANLTQGTARVAASPDVDPRYLRWALRSKMAIGHWDAAVGGATFRALNLGPLAETPVPFRRPPDQRAIADYLDAETARIDALIAKKQQLIHLLEERWRAAIDALIEGLPGPRVPLRRFVRLITQGMSPQAGNVPYSPGKRGLLKLSAVRFGEYRPAENKELDSDFDFSRAVVPAAGDVLVTRANTPQLVGDACAVRCPDPNVVLCDLIYLLQLDERLSSEFAAYVLIGERSRHELSSLARGSSQSMVKLRGEDVVSICVPAVPKREQGAVVQELDRKRGQTALAVGQLQCQIDLLAEHRQALITATVTGEFTVPDSSRSSGCLAS